MRYVASDKYEIIQLVQNSDLSVRQILARLRTLDGIKIIYQRAGSVVSDISQYPVDVYEISLPDGQKVETLFISSYHKINSGKAPSGFTLTYP